MATVYYCTHRDLKDVYPHIDEFDTKTAIYGWVTTGTTSLYLARDSGLVTVLFANGEDLGDPEANSGVVNANGEWYYDSNLDTVYYFNSASEPIDMLMEGGEDFNTLITRYRGNASRYFEAACDSFLPREMYLNADGEYDYIIKRVTALLTAAFLIRASDPQHPQGEPLWTEAMETIDALREGRIKFSKDVTSDSSKGVVREVNVSGTIRLVDTRGRYKGTYDKIKVKIDTTGGAIGTATYSVWVKDGTNLGGDGTVGGVEGSKVVDKQVITGDYQTLSGGLQIRFAGTSATANDTWEVEVQGFYEEIDTPHIKSTRLTRR